MSLPRNHWSAANLRRAAPGPVSRAAGTRAAVDPRVEGPHTTSTDYVNPFISEHVPTLWGSLIQEFGRPVGYWLNGDSATETTVTIIWKEGVEDEVVSPGRYSRALIQVADLPRPPTLRDAIVKDGVIYDLARIEAFAYPYCQAVLKDRIENF